MFQLIFYEPRIPPNTGNAIRLAAATGATLNLVEPLAFDLSDAKLRRAGLDYHDLAHVCVHVDWTACLAHLVAVGSENIYAFTRHARTNFATVAYRPGDALLFGPEPSSLPERILADRAVSERVRIPMLGGVRSLNLSNCAAIAVYEAWRQQGFADAI